MMLTIEKSYKVHTYANDSTLKIYLDKGSVIELNTQTGKGHAELLRKRAVFLRSELSAL